jgi:DNA-binding CsgD family transcriptional regulator
METLAINDIQHLNQGIQQLYTLSDLATFKINALSIIDRLVPSQFPCFQSTHHQTGDVSYTFLNEDPGFVTPELNAVVSQYYAEHPIVQHMPQTLHGAYKISDFLTQSEFHRLEGLYHRYLRLFGLEEMMTLFLPSTNGRTSNFMPTEPLVGFAFQRSERSFTERDRLILNLLRPHLHQAYTNSKNHQQLQQNATQLQQSLDCLGAISLDGEGRVLSIAPQAIPWLETYFARTTYCQQLPDRLWSWVKYQIARIAATDLVPICLPLRIQQSGRELTIRLVIESMGNRYLLLLEEQTLSSFQSLELLGLSQRETEVLSLVIQGNSNKTIATQLGVKTSTVRKHLENIYLKFGVGSRTEAIAQALEKLGLLKSLSCR